MVIIMAVSLILAIMEITRLKSECSITNSTLNRVQGDLISCQNTNIGFQGTNVNCTGIEGGIG